MTDLTTGVLGCEYLIVYAALARILDPDNPEYNQAMESSYADAFRGARLVEITALNQR